MTHELRFLRNGEVTLALEVRGSGPVALLFVHGWISARRMWYDVAARLDPARYTAPNKKTAKPRPRMHAARNEIPPRTHRGSALGSAVCRSSRSRGHRS